MTSNAPSPSRAAPALTSDRLVLPALGVVAAASAAFIYNQTRGSSFSPDEFSWIANRRGNDVGAFLSPYSGHLSLVPVAIYRLLFATVGISSFVPYRLLLAVVASLAGLVFFVYARPRVGRLGALGLATLLLFLGPGWNDIMQPFQIAWLIAVAGGLLALLLLDRGRPGSDLLACLALIVAVSSTSVGVAMLIGATVDVALHRRRWRDAWIPGIPLVLYAVWAVHYHPSTIVASDVVNAPLDLVQTTGAAVAGVLGLSGVSPSDLTGVMLTFGISLLALAAAVAVLRRPERWDAARFVSLAVTLVVFSLLVTLVRSFQSPFESRYIYVTCVLVALLGVELLRGVSVAPRAQAGLAVLVVVAVVSDLSDLRGGGAEFRALGAQTDATLGAVQLDRNHVDPTRGLTSLPLYGFFTFTAGQYFAAAHALGTPAFTIPELRRTSPAARRSADAQSLADGDVRLASAPGSSTPAGPGVAVTQASAGTIARSGSCLRFTPAATGTESSVTVRVAGGRMLVAAGSAPVAVAAGRFAGTPLAVGTVRPAGSGLVTVVDEPAAPPWRLRLQSGGPVRVCTTGVA